MFSPLSTVSTSCTLTTPSSTAYTMSPTLTFRAGTSAMQPPDWRTWMRCCGVNSMQPENRHIRETSTHLQIAHQKCSAAVLPRKMRKGLHHWVLIQHMPVVIVVLDKVVACHVRLYESEPAILHLDDPTRQKSEVTLRQLLIELARNIPAEGLCLQRTIRASTNQIPFFPSWIIKKSQVSTPRVRACKLAMLSSKYASRLARFLKNLTTSPSLQSSLHAKYTLRVGWGGSVLCSERDARGAGMGPQATRHLRREPCIDYGSNLRCAPSSSCCRSMRYVR